MERGTQMQELIGSIKLGKGDELDPTGIVGASLFGADDTTTYDADNVGIAELPIAWDDAEKRVTNLLGEVVPANMREEFMDRFDMNIFIAQVFEAQGIHDIDKDTGNGELDANKAFARIKPLLQSTVDNYGKVLKAQRSLYGDPAAKDPDKRAGIQQRLGSFSTTRANTLNKAEQDFRRERSFKANADY